MRHIACAALAAALVGTFACQSASADSTATARKATPAAKTAAAPAAAKADTLRIAGTIIEIPGKFPPNDLYNYVYIMKYRVTKVVKGTFSGQEILVGVYNPLIPRQQIKDKMDAFVDGNATEFKMGLKHELTLIKPVERIWKDAVEDEYVDSDADKYYALKVDVAK